MNYTTLKLETFLKRTNPFMRFLLVGGINTLTGLSIMFMLLNIVGWSYWLSTFTGNTVGSVVSYFLNRVFTFRSRVRLTKGAPRFISVILICYFGAYFISEKVVGMINWIPLSFHNDIAVLIGACLYTISNYFGQKYLVFR
ncbi:GtrA family protein [Pseudoneobacillus sp. C159]